MHNRAPILELRPTQIAVGMQQVEAKYRKLKRVSKVALRTYLKARPVPCVRGPGGVLYIVDHHHLCCTVHKMGETFVLVDVVLDLSHDHVSDHEFWTAMHNNNYVCTQDQYGNPVDLARLPQMLPKTIEGLKNDPYRAMAAVIRKAGAFDKVWTPFVEFQWANHFRAINVPPLHTDQVEFTDAEVTAAVAAAGAHEASHLPGYKGPAVTDGAVAGSPSDGMTPPPHP
jgi:hypothetical protein